jgi:signal peptidase I
MIAGAVTLAAVVFVRTFVIQVYGILTPSMGPTLLPGDYVITSSLALGSTVPGTRLTTPRFRDPRAGEVVVYGEKPGEPPVRIIKRVIGLPGDTVAMIGGRVIRNGVVLDEPYAAPVSHEDEPLDFKGPYGVAWHLAALSPAVAREAYRPTRDRWGPLIVPAASYLLLGDDRDRSRDSRVTGFVSREQIRGSVIAVYYSVRPGPSRFAHAITGARWSRIGQRVR